VVPTIKVSNQARGHQRSSHGTRADDSASDDDDDDASEPDSPRTLARIEMLKRRLQAAQQQQQSQPVAFGTIMPERQEQ
jgi:hypothetical protein